jgi:tetratricopeptide (TPR) repeat protein
VVAVFANQTGDPTLDRVGYLAGDWISQGLLEAQVMEVVPWVSAHQASVWVQAELEAGRVRNPLEALAAETGANVVISGAIYRERESISFHIQINDASDGKLLAAPDPVAGPVDSVSAVVARARERAMGSMAVLFDERFGFWVGAAQQPPSPAAYQEFSAGMERYNAYEYSEAIPYFRRATELDSTFVQATILLAISRSNMGQLARADSLLRGLEPRRDRMNTFDRLWFDGTRAWVGGDLEMQLASMRPAAEMAPGSKAVYNWGYAANRTNRPEEAIEALSTLDPERGPMRGWRSYFHELIWAHHALGEHERELDLANRARQLYPNSTSFLLYQIRALAALGRPDEVLRLLSPGVDVLGPNVVGQAGAALFRHGHREEAFALFERIIAWYEAQAPDGRDSNRFNRGMYGEALNLTGRHEQALEVFRQLVRERPSGPLALTKLGVAAAWAGDREEALAMDARVAAAAMDRPFLSRVLTSWRAEIAAALGDRTRAVRLLEEAYDQGHLGFFIDWHVAPELQSLWDFPPYQEFMRPKG